MMKQAFIILALIGVAFSAPQPRKLFSDHVQDFLDLIGEKSGHDLEHLMEHYLEYEEFLATLKYISTNNFKDLIYEMESLPEFNAVIDFLENDNIDIHVYVDMINEFLDNINKMRRSLRHSTSGTTLTAFIYDCIAEFPKAELSALFDEKMANDEAFSTAINNLQSEEWDRVFTALFENETFQKEVQALKENGVDIDVLFDEVMAIFGQN